MAGFLLLVALPLAAGTAAADPSGSPSPSPSPSRSSGTAAPAVAPAGTVTATATVDCAAQAVVVTAHNTTAAAVAIGVFANGAGVPMATLNVAAGSSGTVRAEPGAGPFDLVVQRLDTGAVLATAEGFFSCPARRDLSITVRSGSAHTARDVCAVAFLRGPRGPLHGTLTVQERGFRYVPAVGYTGPDRFDYQCLTSEGVFGTVRVTVLPATAPVAPPAAAAPALPATGTGRLPAELAAGVVLVALGALALRLTRG
jgi:hypothetical protein